MSMRFPLVEKEWYHCYNRGADKRQTFRLAADYRRLQTLLWACNGTEKIHLSDFKEPSIAALIAEEVQRGEPLVEIAAYSLMPNHLHLVLSQLVEKGITIFMQRVFTAYTMYYNKRHHRTGVLFAGPFKSKHIDDDRYLKRVVPYVLLNAGTLAQPGWEYESGLSPGLKKKLMSYPYSSLPDFFGARRPENGITGPEIHSFYDPPPTLEEMLTEAQTFYHEEIPEF